MRAIELLFLTTQTRLRSSFPLGKKMDAISVSHSPESAREHIYIYVVLPSPESPDPGFAQKWHSSVWTAAHVIVMYALSGWTVGVGGWVEFGHWGIDRDGSPSSSSGSGGSTKDTRLQAISAFAKRKGLASDENNENEGKIIPFAFTGT